MRRWCLPEAADRPTTRRRLPAAVTVTLLIVLPFVVPMVWVVGALVLASERPRGWHATLAMSVGGLRLPLWLYGSTIDGGFPPAAGYPLAAVTLLGCLIATHRIVSR